MLTFNEAWRQLCYSGHPVSSSSYDLFNHYRRTLNILFFLHNWSNRNRVLKCTTLLLWQRVRFYNKVKETIRKRILRFFTRQINPRSLGSWCVKGIEESTLEVDSSVPVTQYDPKNLGLICLEKKRKTDPFLDSFGFKNPIFDFLKKCTLKVADM